LAKANLGRQGWECNMIAIRISGVLALLAGACLSLAACFGSSSGGPGTVPVFDAGDLDGFGADSTLPEESGTDSAPDAAPEAGQDAGLDAPSTSDSSQPDAADSAMPPDAGDAGGALVRFANLVPNLGSAVDFCVAATGNAFAVPYMNAQGVPAGLSYKDVSDYAALAPASGFNVRVVAAGSASCSTALAADVSVGPSTSASPTTVTFTGVAGDAGPVPVLNGLHDDPAATSPSTARFRAVHAASSLGAVDFEIGVSPYTSALQTGVTYGAAFAPATVASGGPTPDAQGYVVTAFNTAQVTLLVASVETTSFYVGDNGTSTASVTAFLVGAAGSVADPVGFVDCDELAAPTGHKSSCPFNAAPPVTIPTRIFHGAPDQGAIDVCAGLAPASEPYSASLIAAAGNTGATFLQLTGDLTSIPANTDFKVAFTAAGQSCATGTFSAVSSSLRYQELTLGLLETYGGSTSYLAYPFETNITAAAGAVTLSFGSLAQQTAGGQIVDLFAAVNGMAEVSLFAGIGGANYGGSVTMLPGTTTFRVEDDTTHMNVYDKGGFTLNSNGTYFLWWLNQGSATAGTLAQCPLEQRTSDSLVTCPN
jgi:hypothetical protein